MFVLTPRSRIGVVFRLHVCLEIILMERSATAEHRHKVHNGHPDWQPDLLADARWQLVQRVIAGPHFSRSPLLSKFLLFVVAETLEGHAEEITEHQIGVQVFDRPADYRTLEDNIVRNYARQLRKRLAEHFAAEGSSEPWRIEIPLGGYVPVFLEGSESGHPEEAIHAGPVPVTLKIRAEGMAETREAVPASGPRGQSRLRSGLALAAYTLLLVGATWFAARSRPIVPPPEPAHLLWANLFSAGANCYIVPSDAGFNLLEDLSHRPLPLAEYMQGIYQTMPLAGMDEHSAADLRSQELTPFVDSQIVATLASLREANPNRVSVRFPRDLRLDDLKNANAVILGSVSSNPWAAVADANASFRIVDSPGMKGATILNLKPQPGEAASYVSHWDEPAHETFALIAYLPNLSGTGNLLVLQGLDVAGTQAAAEMLFRPSAMEGILKRAARPDGTLNHFEVLLRSTSIGSNATGTQVIASRIYPR